MKRKSWLLLAVLPILLATYTLRRSPVSVDGVEAPTGDPVEVQDFAAQLKNVLSQPVTPAPDVTPAAPVVTPPVAEAPVVPGSGDLTDQEELRAIDTYAVQERQKIEAWYASELTSLKAQVERILQDLNGEDKLAWSRFYQRANETWSTTRGYEDTSVYDFGTGFSSGSGFRSQTTQTFVKGNPAGEYEATLNWIKEAKRTTQQDFVNIQNRLAWLREQKLAAVQTEVARRKSVVALRRSRVQMETTRKSSGDPTPTVEAVATTVDNRFFALIGDKFVYEGNTVQGYRVRKIHTDSVEFEKDGKTWVQKVE